MSPSLREYVADPAAHLPFLSAHSLAAAQALFVTFLWSTSFVLVKVGLRDIPALTFAGLRYALAALCLVPLLLRPANRAEVRALSGRQWGSLVVLGLVYYAVTQGAQFVALDYLPAVTVSLLLNFTPVLVAGAGVVLLAEHPTGRQWVGVALSTVGALVYFLPVDLPAGRVFGLAVMCVGLAANAAAAVHGRHVNSGAHASPLVVTAVSMGIGSAVLLAAGLAVQGLPRLSLANWAIVGWLAVVNTAFAFTLWNHTLQTLSAMESSVINNTMLVQIAVLGWVFLDETLTVGEGVGLAVAGFGALLVQLRRA